MKRETNEIVIWVYLEVYSILVEVAIVKDVSEGSK